MKESIKEYSVEDVAKFVHFKNKSLKSFWINIDEAVATDLSEFQYDDVNKKSETVYFQKCFCPIELGETMKQ